MKLKPILILVILLLTTAMSGWATTSFVIGPSPTSVNGGDTFTLGVVLVDFNINPSAEDQVAAFGFDLVFPTFLQVLTNPTEDGFFALSGNGCCFGWNSIDNVNGVISGLSDFSANPDSGLDPVVDIQFTAVAAGSGQVTLQNVSLSDMDGNAIDFGGVTGGDVSATTPEPDSWAMAGLGVAILIAWNRRRAVQSMVRSAWRLL
jgi:PEP-CTERM motif